jgi:hypothetical protein
LKVERSKLTEAKVLYRVAYDSLVTFATILSLKTRASFDFGEKLKSTPARGWAALQINLEASEKVEKAGNCLSH